LKLLLDTLRWLAGHAIQFGAIVGVLLVSGLIVSSVWPGLKIEYEKRHQRVRALEKEKQSAKEKLELAEIHFKQANQRMVLLKTRHLARIENIKKYLAAKKTEAVWLKHDLLLKKDILKFNLQPFLSFCQKGCSIWIKGAELFSEKKFCKDLEASCSASKAQARALKVSMGLMEAQVRAAGAEAIDAATILRRMRSPDWLLSDPELSAAAQKLGLKRRERSRLDRARDRSESELESARAQLNASLLAGLNRWKKKLEVEWSMHGLKYVLWALAILLSPACWKLAWYYILMPGISRLRPLQLVERTPDADMASLLPPSTRCSISIGAGDRLAVRSQWLKIVGDEQGVARRRTKVFWRWSSPFVSYSARLFLLTEVYGESERSGTPAAVAEISSPDDPDREICRLDIPAGHPGFIIHPRHLVGIQGDIELRSVLKLFSPHAWATRQIRFFLFSGPGSIYLAGYGGVTGAPAEGLRLRIDEEVVVGYDAALQMSTRRTETFVPYLLGKSSLVDDSFEGPGLVLSEAVPGGRAGAPNTKMEGFFQGLITAVGKFFGF